MELAEAIGDLIVALVELACFSVKGTILVICLIIALLIGAVIIHKENTKTEQPPATQTSNF